MTTTAPKCRLTGWRVLTAPRPATARLRRLSLMQLRLGLAYRAAVLENTRLAEEAAA